MNGYSVKLPLKYDTGDGPYLMNTNLKDVVKQNLKMLVMTSPGERIMNIDYGVGIKNFLFQNDGIVQLELEDRIRNQVSKYLPFITIESIIFQDISDQDSNSIYFSLSYKIPSIKEVDEISLILNID